MIMKREERGREGERDGSIQTAMTTAVVINT